MASHPCANKKAQRWGTVGLRFVEENTGKNNADPSTSLRNASLWGGFVVFHSKRPTLSAKTKTR